MGSDIKKQPWPEGAVLATRDSLLSRLRSWDNQDSWRQFFDTYWRLIYDVAIKAGLNDAGAHDVVQETVFAVAKLMPGFRYDRKKGSFKGWLMQITRRRIADQMRKQYRHGLHGRQESLSAGDEADESDANGVAEGWSALWEAEWRSHLMAAATAAVKQKVQPQQFQIFELNVLHEWPAKKVAAKLGVTLMQVYLAKHRVGGEFRRELRRLERLG